MEHLWIINDDVCGLNPIIELANLTTDENPFIFFDLNLSQSDEYAINSLTWDGKFEIGLHSNMSAEEYDKYSVSIAKDEVKLEELFNNANPSNSAFSKQVTKVISQVAIDVSMAFKEKCSDHFTSSWHIQLSTEGVMFAPTWHYDSVEHIPKIVDNLIYKPYRFVIPLVGVSTPIFDFYGEKNYQNLQAHPEYVIQAQSGQGTLFDPAPSLVFHALPEYKSKRLRLVSTIYCHNK